MALLIYESKTGNTKTFVDFVTKHINVEIGDYKTNIVRHQKIIIGAYSWGNGKIPVELKKFLIDNKDKWRGKQIFIFGSGNSIYPKFCGAVDGIKTIVEDCGAEVIGFFKFEQRFDSNDYSTGFLSRMLQKLV